MDVETKIIEIESYMMRTETQLQVDLHNDLCELNSRRIAIEEKYDLLKQETIEQFRDEKEKVQRLCEQAKTLVEGIRRKLFKKQHRSVTSAQDASIQEPEYVLADLQREIDKFETSSLPYGIRQLFDSVSLFFNSNYGQTEVDKIIRLYQSMVQIQENGELDKKLNDELSKLEQAQLREIYSIDRTMASIIEERVDGYIFALNKMIFTT